MYMYAHKLFYIQYCTDLINIKLTKNRLRTKYDKWAWMTFTLEFKDAKLYGNEKFKKGNS